MYLLPDKRRSGRRKTHVSKKTLNPVFDQSFDFSVSLPEVQRRTLDVAVKNSGGFLSKDKGLLGKSGSLEVQAEVRRQDHGSLQLRISGLKQSVSASGVAGTMAQCWDYRREPVPSAQATLTDDYFKNPQVLVALASEELAKGWTQWAVGPTGSWGVSYAVLRYRIREVKRQDTEELEKSS
ncbi:Extended synaptotagmin-2 [Plecturocebus cupreus]